MTGYETWPRADRPRVAVVTAGCRQHDDHLDQIGALARAAVTPDLHVVISMGDRDLTRGRVPLRHDRWETIVSAMPPGPQRARRVLARDAGARAAVEAGAELLIFLDADALPSLHLVERYAEALARPAGEAPRVLCGGLVDPGPRPAAGYEWSLLDRLVADDLAATGLGAGEELPEPHVERFRAASFGLSAADLDRLGGMVGPDLAVGDHDLDLASRLREAGGSLAWLAGVAALRRPRSLADLTPEEIQTLVRAANRYEERWSTLVGVPVLMAAERAELLRRDVEGRWAAVAVRRGTRRAVSGTAGLVSVVAQDTAGQHHPEPDDEQQHPEARDQAPPAADHHLDDERHPADERQPEGGERGLGELAAGRDQPGLLPTPEEEAVRQHRRQVADGGERDEAEDDEVEHAVTRGQLAEPLGEGQREQEAEEDLDPGLRHPQLLEQLVPVAVQPLGRRLVPAGAALRRPGSVRRPTPLLAHPSRLGPGPLVARPGGCAQASDPPARVVW